MKGRDQMLQDPEVQENGQNAEMRVPSMFEVVAVNPFISAISQESTEQVGPFLWFRTDDPIARLGEINDGVNRRYEVRNERCLNMWTPGVVFKILDKSANVFSAIMRQSQLEMFGYPDIASVLFQGQSIDAAREECRRAYEIRSLGHCTAFGIDQSVISEQPSWSLLKDLEEYEYTRGLVIAKALIAKNCADFMHERNISYHWYL